MITVKADALWAAVRDGLRSDLVPNVYELWLPGIRFGEISESTVTVEVADSIHQSYVEDNLLALLKKRLFNVTDQAWNLKVLVNMDVGRLEQGELFAQEEVLVPEPGSKAAAKAAVGSGNSGKAASAKLCQGTLRNGYTFDNYVVGPSNSMAVASAQRAAAQAGSGQSGSVLICGGPGLGKTHLLHAIAKDSLERNSKCRVALLSALDWVEEFVEAVKNGTTGTFRAKYRSIDLLLVDDVQLLAGKERTQEEFFNTFNLLHNGNKQIVFTSDRPVTEIRGLEERLISRFTWGMTAYLSPPDYEMRRAILRRDIGKLPRNTAMGFSEEVIDYVAQRVKKCVRRLESAVVQISVWLSLNTGRPLTPEILSGEILTATFSAEAKANVTPERIVEKVVDVLRVKGPDLRGPRRTASLAWARQVAMYLCRKETEMTLQEISEFFGKKDHGTVMHAVKKVEECMERDVKVSETVRLLLRELQA